MLRHYIESKYPNLEVPHVDLDSNDSQFQLIFESTNPLQELKFLE